MCSIDLAKTYNSVDRTFLLTVLARVWRTTGDYRSFFAISTMECLRASGRMMADIQTGSAWGRAYGRDARSDPSCSTRSLLPYCVWRWSG